MNKVSGDVIFIVIPVLNRWHFTNACLSSLTQQTDMRFKVVVVDHGSTDGTSEKIASLFPDVIVIEGDDSMWWSAAVNLGINYALNEGAAFILTLNNDTLARADYIEKLHEAITDAPENSLIGSASIDADSGELTYCGEQINWFLETSSPFLSNRDKWETKKIIRVSHFPGRGLLVPAKVFKQLGLFDETHFPHYMADYEFTLRASANNFPVFCALNACIVTYPEASGANEIKKHRSVKGYQQYLFGMKGSGNLPLFYRYALRHCPAYALPSHLLLGTARRLIGYWI